MEYTVRRKVSFVEEAIIEADSFEEAKEKLKTAQLDWDVDFDFFPEIESVYLYSDDSGEEEELPNDYMEEDYVNAMNGCIIFNEEEFEKYR